MKFLNGCRLNVKEIIRNLMLYSLFSSFSITYHSGQDARASTKGTQYHCLVSRLCVPRYVYYIVTHHSPNTHASKVLAYSSSAASQVRKAASKIGSQTHACMQPANRKLLTPIRFFAAGRTAEPPTPFKPSHVIHIL
jgi:hypothetical protein